jgi:dihydrofolate reductase
MRKLIVIEYMSLNRVIQGPGHSGEDSEGGFSHGGWTVPFMTDHRRYNSESFPGAGAFLLGRKTYEIWADYWPTVTDEDDEIARSLNDLPKYVASTTIDDAAWEGTTVIKEDLVGEVEKLKQRSGKPRVVLGSSRLAQTLIEHKLIDEYQLWLHPVVLGEGKRLFDEGCPRIDLRLVDTRTSRRGLVILTYEPNGH